MGLSSPDHMLFAGNKHLMLLRAGSEDKKGTV